MLVLPSQLTIHKMQPIPRNRCRKYTKNELYRSEMKKMAKFIITPMSTQSIYSMLIKALEIKFKQNNLQVVRMSPVSSKTRVDRLNQCLVKWCDPLFEMD